MVALQTPTPTHRPHQPLQAKNAPSVAAVLAALALYEGFGDRRGQANAHAGLGHINRGSLSPSSPFSLCPCVPDDREVSDSVGATLLGLGLALGCQEGSQVWEDFCDAYEVVPVVDALAKELEQGGGECGVPCTFGGVGEACG